MKIAIIGASSLLGSTISSIAQLQHSVILIGRDQALSYNYPDESFHSGFDVQNLLDFDAIVYCVGAGIQPGNSDTQGLIFELNAFEPIRLIEKLQQAGFKGKLFTFGSYFEIGNAKPNHFFDETSLVNNKNDLSSTYAKSKSILTHYIDRYNKTLNFDLVHLILPNIYGAGENNQRLFPYIKDCVVNGRKLEFTSGVQVRQFVHVSDIANQVLLMSKDPFRGILNLGSEVLTVKETIITAVKVLGEKYEAKPEFNFSKIQRRDSDMLFLALDDKLARKEFNWSPQVSLEKGIADY